MKSSKKTAQRAKSPQSSPVKRAKRARLWLSNEHTPVRRGWYITGSDSGELQWRAWGCGAWWKQIKGGWIEWFDGDGNAVRYAFMPGFRKPIELNQEQLPEVGEYLLTQLQKRPKPTNSNPPASVYSAPAGKGRAK